MRRTELLFALLAVLIVTSAIAVNLPTTTAQQEPTIAVSPLVIDTRNLKEIGDTFSINVTVANVVKMWGYEFVLRYNASVIDATAFTSIDSRFTFELPSEIGLNYTTVSRGTYNGDPTGVTTTSPIPVVRIDFVVTGNGTTNIFNDPVFAEIANTDGHKVPCITVNGRFSNTQVLATHDIGITAATLSTTSAKAGDQVTITVTVTNTGDFNENVTVTAQYNQSVSVFKDIDTPKPITNLASGANDQVTFNWNTADVPDGKHQVTVKATVTTDDKPSDNTYIAGDVTVGGGGTGGFPMQYIYIIAGVAVVVIAGVAVYALRARKPQS